MEGGASSTDFEDGVASEGAALCRHRILSQPTLVINLALIVHNLDLHRCSAALCSRFIYHVLYFT